MLLTIATTYSPATDLGFLLHKNPARCQQFDLAFGRSYVFFPEAGPERCTAALLLDVDPIGIVRGKAGSAEGGPVLRKNYQASPTNRFPAIQAAIFSIMYS
jgi:hypothetical protein